MLASGLKRFWHTTKARRRSRAALCLALLTGGVLAFSMTYEPTPRAWAVADVPVAFWAWRADAPTTDEIAQARRATDMRTLFLRAGQIDLQAGKPSRVRAVQGALPSDIEIHLVYNATPEMLENFGRADTLALARLLAETFARDCARAEKDAAQVVGLQLDFDVPTRLLTRYSELLRHLRAQLPPATQLSITGLPTWLNDSTTLRRALALTDFWIPQFYGDRVSRNVNERAPIADFDALSRALAHARRLRHPFYAGLPAYGYALVYSRRGALISLHGDLDPARVAQHPHLTLRRRAALQTSTDDDFSNVDDDEKTAAPTAWRYTFVATDDAEIDDVTLRRGEQIVLEIPTIAGVRVMARRVRETGGEELRGICLFRLPATDERTTLPLVALGAALKDHAVALETSLEITSAAQASSDNAAHEVTRSLWLTARNTGAASTLFDNAHDIPDAATALTVTLRVAPGTLRAVEALEGFSRYETLCGGDAFGESQHNYTLSSGNTIRLLAPCSARRAAYVRLFATSWTPAAQARARLIFNSANEPRIHDATASMLDERGASTQRVTPLLVAPSLNENALTQSSAP